MALNKQHNHKASAQAPPPPSYRNGGCQMQPGGKPIAGVEMKASGAVNLRSLVFPQVKLLGSSVFTNEQLVDGFLTLWPVCCRFILKFKEIKSNRCCKNIYDSLAKQLFLKQKIGRKTFSLSIPFLVSTTKCFMSPQNKIRSMPLFKIANSRSSLLVCVLSKQFQVTVTSLK